VKDVARWHPTKFERVGARLRGSRDPRELAVGSRLISDLVAALYDEHLPRQARGRLLDLGCGKVPLYGAYAAFVAEVTCVDWAPGQHIDVTCDLAQALPFDAAAFDTIVLSDVLEHIAQPEALWAEMQRVLAPGGVLVMNVPFYYSVHAHPHDYYRYTNFALERFVRLQSMELVHLSAVGGILEVMADLHAKALSKLPLIGSALATAVQGLAARFTRTRLGARVARTSSRHFPLGYFLVARKPDAGTLS
jgi:SAM-dependent methyltransferase